MKDKHYPIGLAAATLMASLFLVACGGGSASGPTNFSEAKTGSIPDGTSSAPGEDLPRGVSAAALQRGYGLPQPQAAIEVMAKRLVGHFNGRHANAPESLMGAEKGPGSPKAAPDPQVVYRFFNTRTGVHFYTISTQERDQIVANFPWFSLDGAAFHSLQAPSAGLSPVYRFYNRVSGTHFYTISESERDNVLANLGGVFQLEGVGWHASTSAGEGWEPVHRFFNTRNGTHFYTSSDEERTNVAAHLKQFTYEGIGYYVRSTGDPFLSGTVAAVGLVRNALVCLDIDHNSACDSGEPASPRTGADGIYSISFARSAVSEAEQAGASLIALMVPGDPASGTTALDQSHGLAVTTSAYVLRQVPGKAGQISPLSTLVAAGVAAGMTESNARRNASIQLGFPEAKIDDYQDDPAMNDAAPVDSARLMAYVVARALEGGVALDLAEQTGAVQARLWDLRSLNYTDANNFNYLEYALLDKPEGEVGVSLTDWRLGRSGGVLVSDEDLYNQAYLAPGGWTRCWADVPLTAKLGRPSRATFCNALQTVSYWNNTDIAGRTMASVVTDMQNGTNNIINAGISSSGLMGALGNTTFPAASAIRTGYTLNLNQPVYLNSINTDGRTEGVDATLEALMRDHSVADADAALPGIGASLTLGLGSGSLKNLRVAFIGALSATAGLVQFYECDLNSSQTVASNCAKLPTTGSYTITTLHGDRVMSFTGHAPTAMSHERLYVEVSETNHANGLIGGTNWVFMARRLKPGFAYNASDNTRLNGTAWGAMKAQLGI